MERTPSILKTGGAAPSERRSTSVHYPGEGHILQIIPPGWNGSSRLGKASASEAAPPPRERRGSAHGRMEGDGNGNGTNTPRAKSWPRVVDYDSQGELTPVPETIEERLDFSVVFGDEYQAKYMQMFEDDENSPPAPSPNTQTKEQTKEQRRKNRAPEQKITIFAFRLALIEKMASGLGKIAFLWATVVLLGGFASTVRLTDFLVVTAIILAEASRIFSRSHELEWQRLSSKRSGGLGVQSLFSITSNGWGWNRVLDGVRSFRRGSSSRLSSKSRKMQDPGAPRRVASASPTSSTDADMITPTNSDSTSSRHIREMANKYPTAKSLPARLPRPISAQDVQKRRWDPLFVPLITSANHVLTTDTVSRFLSVCQLLSASVGIVLAFWRLSSQNFYPTQPNDAKLPNVVVSMNLFYVLAVVEAGLFLFEKGYLEYRLVYKKLLEQVCEENDQNYVRKEHLGLIRHFFNDVYAKALEGSVFDGLDMDLVQYSISWISSEDFQQQLDGARMLNSFVSTPDDKFRENDRFAADALRRLGTTPGIIERLVEMLSWGSKHEEALLVQVSTIICRLVVYNRNCARFVAVPGSMDGVVSLLFPHTSHYAKMETLRSMEPWPGIDGKLARPPLPLHLTGLKILKYLCKDPKNSLKIGEARGLLSILVVFTEARGKSHFEGDGHRDWTQRMHLKTYKKSLQVLLCLAAATNSSGQILRERIGNIVSGLKNLRDIVEYGTEEPELQTLAIEILNHLAMEDPVKILIGATGGTMRLLFRLFADYNKEKDPFSPDGAADQKKKRAEWKKASVKAGETLTRLALQNEKNCHRLLELKELKDGKEEKVLIPVTVEALSKASKFSFDESATIEDKKAAKEETDKIASSAAQILHHVLKYADYITRAEIARQTATVVVSFIFVKSGESTKSELYEASMGLAARILPPLNKDTYKEILKSVNKVQFVEQLIKNLQHTPTTNKFPRIRRYSVELIIAFIEKDDAFLEAFKNHNIDLRGVLEKSLDSVSHVENFCLFSGLQGYTRHLVDIEDLIETAIKKVDNYHSGHSRQNSAEEVAYP